MAKRKQPAPAWRDVYRVHPAADVFPMLSEPELRELGEDIKANGLVTPIVFWRPGETDNEETVLLDGRNRLDAMELVGLPTIAPNEYLSGGAWAFDEGTWKLKGAKKGQMPGWRPVQYLSGKRRGITGLFDGGAMVDRVTEATDPVAYVIGANIRRRHLTKTQQAEMIAMAVTAGNDRANVARSFSPKPGKRGGSTKDPIKATVVEEAKKLDISPRTARRALQVVRDKESAKEAATGSRVSPDPDHGKGRGRAEKAGNKRLQPNSKEGRHRFWTVMGWIGFLADPINVWGRIAPPADLDDGARAQIIDHVDAAIAELRRFKQRLTETEV
jgi:hypothetical protein